ncbi:MAG: 1-deoxy-D-xylulose-5-phosphate reductoisomerase, partial [Rhizomicrobium sp.]
MMPVLNEPSVAGILHRRLTILGSTGSIGLSTLDVVAHARAHYGADALPIEALTAQTNTGLLAQQARRFRPRLAVVADESRYSDLKQALAGEDVELAAGRDAVTEAAARASDVVMVAIVGAAALKPTLAAARRGATIALAN